MENPPKIESPRKPILTGPKRQHYLPRFYLDGFCTDGLLSLFDRDKSEYRKQQPQNTAVEGHFYTFEDEQGRKRYEVEAMFSQVESNAKPVITKLCAGEPLSIEERWHLAEFIACGHGRTPEAVDSIKHMYAGVIKRVSQMAFSDPKRVMGMLEDRNGHLDEAMQLEKAAELVNFVQNGSGYTVKVKDKFALAGSLNAVPDVANAIVRRNWLVLHRERERDSFITTDCPVVLGRLRESTSPFFRGVGFASTDALILFPLRQDACLLCAGTDAVLGHQSAAQSKIRDINLLVASNCQRFVIGRDEALIRNIVERTGIRKSQWTPRFSVS